MSAKDDGGPAYPMFKPLTEIGAEEYYTGMSLRDAFAIAALSGLMPGADDETYEETAHSAYKQADAMLEARKA